MGPGEHLSDAGHPPSAQASWHLPLSHHDDSKAEHDHHAPAFQLRIDTDLRPDTHSSSEDVPESSSEGARSAQPTDLAPTFVSFSRKSERTATSCSECRRRKQKCSQGQPCANCERRVPQPVCEYSSRRRSKPSPLNVSVSPDTSVLLQSPQLDDTMMPGISVGLLASPQPPWARSHGDTVADMHWSNTDLATRFPASPDDGSWTSLISKSPRASVSHWVGASLSQCDHGCTLHAEAVHDAIRAIASHRVSIPDRFLDPSWSPDRLLSVVNDPKAVVEAGIGNMYHLPLDATHMNAELLRIYVKLLARFKSSVDGNPGANNPMMRYWVPFCIQDPLLLKVILYTSACFLGETGHLPSIVVASIKGAAIRCLNARLRDPNAAARTDDATIGGVVQLIVDEWYWGDTDELRAHMRGLREMVRLRGGLQHLGMHGFLSKFVMVHDIVIALVHEAIPFVLGDPEADWPDAATVPFRLSHNTPLVRDLPSFAECAVSLILHPSTASILDDLRFLIESAVSLPSAPTAQQLQKVKSTASWVQDRISSLPSEVHPLAADSDSQDCDGSTIDRLDVPRPPGHTGSACSASPDYMYSCVRAVALIYSRALANGTPLSTACSAQDCLHVWVATWRVPLSVWRGVVGIYMWIMLAIAPRCLGTPHARFVKSMTMISVMTLALDNWHVTMAASRAAVRLQTWLRLAAASDAGTTAATEAPDEPRATSSADAVALHGFQSPGWADERSDH